MLHVEVIGGYGTEVDPAVVLTTGSEGMTRPIYLLNAPEGLCVCAGGGGVTECARERECVCV